MELTHLIAFNVALFAALASPGPALLVAIKTTLSAGRRAGIAVGLGLALVAAMWTAAALLGLDALFLLFPWTYTVVKTAGALYLLYVAYAMWKGARDAVETDMKPAARAFRQGVTINLLNPKSVLFAAAVLVVIFPSDMSMRANAVIVFNHFVIEAIFYSGLAFAMSSVSVSRAYLRAKAYTDRFAAVVLGALGLRLLLSR